jgi:uncharacterized protein
MPTYVSQYVIKVCGRCDLACDHCYVYEHADQTWRHKPKVIADETVAQAARRIAEHARRHQLARVSVVLHGGEPLLLGHDRLRGVLHALRSVIDPATRLSVVLHTNGVRLDEKFCDLFAQYGVRVGISLDGDQAANDRHRRFADGRSSHDQVLRALALLNRPEYRHLFGGILCTVDVANDPIAVYEAMLAQAPPNLDLLLPHATWDDPPAGPPGAHAPYAAWLGKIHARWVRDGRPVPIRFFNSLLAAWEGRGSGSESVGLDPVDLLVIDTDGSWEQADSLKTAYDGAPETGMNVFFQAVDEAAAHPGLAARRTGLDGLSPACRACPIVRACGGGLYAHRYKSGSGFNNPSVYCDDLKVLIPQVTSAPQQAPQPRGSSRPVGRPARQAGRSASHQLGSQAFDLLSAGAGDRTAMRALGDVMYSVNRALVVEVARRVDPASSVPARAAADGWRLLCQLDAEHPEAVREVLTYPYVQAWATRLLARAEVPGADLYRAHLGGIAAAAALRAGLDAEVTVPVLDGAVHLPAAGAFVAAAGTGPVARVRVSPSGVTAASSLGEWQAVRGVSADGASVTLDDTDPFRYSQQWTASGRLPDATWELWRHELLAAISLLTAELPGYAEVLRAGLRSVVPILPSETVLRQSGSARQAFGAVAVALPGHPGSLSELLLHEMQHVKLAALITMFEFDLFDRHNESRFQVPWRNDARPFEGLLHGAYAHLAVAELWRIRAMAGPGEPAAARYRTYRSWVEDAIDQMLASGCLLPLGERFVTGMQGTVRGWVDDW